MLAAHQARPPLVSAEARDQIGCIGYIDSLDRNSMEGRVEMVRLHAVGLAISIRKPARFQRSAWCRGSRHLSVL
jgi:hypothetical protein